MGKKTTTPDTPETTPETTPERAPVANIIWRGETDPPSSVSIGNMPVVHLPDAETQRGGFYVRQAGIVLESVAGYKRLVNGRPAEVTSPIPAASIPVPSDEREKGGQG
jgi:hypothetical protein